MLPKICSRVKQKRSITACSGKQRTYQRTAVSRWTTAYVFINSPETQFTHFALGLNTCNFWHRVLVVLLTGNTSFNRYLT